MPLRYRRTRKLGRGFYSTVTNRGVRLGWRSRGRPGVTVSEGKGGQYLSVRLLRGLWDVLQTPRRGRRR